MFRFRSLRIGGGGGVILGSVQDDIFLYAHVCLELAVHAEPCPSDLHVSEGAPYPVFLACNCPLALLLWNHRPVLLTASLLPSLSWWRSALGQFSEVVKFCCQVVSCLQNFYQNGCLLCCSDTSSLIRQSLFQSDLKILQHCSGAQLPWKNAWTVILSHSQPKQSMEIRSQWGRVVSATWGNTSEKSGLYGTTC